MEFDNLFDLPPLEQDELLPELTAKKFIAKTKAMLTLIEREYSQNWIRRRLTEKEYEERDCDNCKQDGCKMIVDGIEFDVFPDNEQGDCFVRIFDHQAFSEFISETVMFGNDTFYELLQCKIITESDAEPLVQPQ